MTLWSSWGASNVLSEDAFCSLLALEESETADMLSASSLLFPEGGGQNDLLSSPDTTSLLGSCNALATVLSLEVLLVTSPFAVV